MPQRAGLNIWEKNKLKPKVIGIDFDNTIIDYSNLFYQLAFKKKLIPKDCPANKAAVKKSIVSSEGGSNLWTALQAEVYGTEILSAKLYEGVTRFFQTMQEYQLYVVSHKTEFSAIGQVNLRKAALSFMHAHHFFDENSLNLNRGQIFFCSTREEKIQTLTHLKCDVFIDDLLEVFTEPSFPDHIKKIHFNITGTGTPSEITMCQSWQEIEDVIHKL